MPIYATIDGVQKELSSLPAMVDGVLKEMSSVYSAVDGVMREVFAVADSILPDGYTLLEYIQSNGTQYIDTGFKPNQDTRVVMCSQITEKPSSSACLFGSRKASGSIDNSLWYVASSNNFQSGFGNAKLTASAPDILVKRVYDKNKDKFYVDGELLIDNADATFQTSWNLFLMENDQNGSAQGNKCAMKLYYCQIYDGAVLIRDYVPCRKNNTGSIGLYDLVNDEFYSSATTSEFIAGYTGNNITFSVLGKTYSAISGMTWGEWIVSDYNTDGYYSVPEAEGNFVVDSSGRYIGSPNSNYYIDDNDVIIASANYGLAGA